MLLMWERWEGSVLGQGRGLFDWRARLLGVIVLRHEFTHCHLSESQRNAIDASFDSRSKVGTLQSIPSSKLTGSLGAWEVLEVVVFV